MVEQVTFVEDILLQGDINPNEMTISGGLQHMTVMLPKAW